jgi:hypothetical protein
VQNDSNESNIIVDEGKIVSLVGWEMAGFFGLAVLARSTVYVGL